MRSASVRSACRRSSAASSSTRRPRRRPSRSSPRRSRAAILGLSDKLVQIWKVSVLLRNLAPRHSAGALSPRIVEDPQFLLAHCLTEPRGALRPVAAYNVPEAAMQTRAVKKNGEWIINGRKQFISNGYDAGLFVVYANTNPKVGMLQGTSSFLVPRDTPGLTIARCNDAGARFMNNGELVFEDMRVPEDHLLAGKAARLGRAGVYFQPGKIIQSAKNLGVGVRAFEVTADYVQNTCRAADSTKHQAVAIRLADMATKIEAVRVLGIRPGRPGGRREGRRRRRSATWPRCSRPRRSSRSPSTRSSVPRQRHDARLRRRKGCATPPSSRTWTAPSTCRASRSSNRCSPIPPANMPGRK